MHTSHINNSEHRFTMISIKNAIKVTNKIPKTILTGLLIMGSVMGTAHSELSIQEQDPGSSIINQYAALKNADAKSPQLHQLIADLNQRLTRNPKDSLAWERNPLYGWCKKNLKLDGTQYDIYSDGLKIYTTLNSRMQRRWKRS